MNLEIVYTVDQYSRGTSKTIWKSINSQQGILCKVQKIAV